MTRRKLAVGDYGLFDGDRLQAVVERKSFDNLLTDVGAVEAPHQHFADLAAVPAAAVVVEAEYRDFLDPSKFRGRRPAAHLARVLGELGALHPRLPIVYAGRPDRPDRRGAGSAVGEGGSGRLGRAAPAFSCVLRQRMAIAIRRRRFYPGRYS